MSGMQRTRSFGAGQFSQALDSWDWIGVSGLRPAFASPFGDVFLQSPAGLWFLDLIEGKLTRQWETSAALKADLNSAEGQDRYLLAGLAFAAESAGIVPSGDQVYGFRVPPMLGGATAVDNIEAADFVVSVNLAGQLHQQIRDLPPGTPIAGLRFSQE